MRICIVAPEQIPVPPVLGGSVEICISAIAKQLAAHHSVTVISRRHRSYANSSKLGEARIVRVPSVSASRYNAEVIRYLRGKSFDIVQVDNRPKLAARIKKTFPKQKVALFLHSLTFVSGPRISRKACSACLAKTDIIVANSTSLQKELSRMFPKHKSKLRKVWLGADLQRFTPADSAARTAGKREFRLRNRFTVLFAGRLIPRKGVPVLLKAMRLVRQTRQDVQLVVAGGAQNPAYKRKLKRMAARLGVPTAFVGNVAHRRIHRLYRSADCFVCPSQRHESFGLVNVEAMASGLPVIASMNGGIQEIVRDGHNGILVKRYKSPGAFAGAIRRIIGDPAMASRLGAQGRSDVLKLFDWRNTAEALSSIYERRQHTNGTAGGEYNR